ncbi:MAG: (Fe-S)-binding protein [Candidatus Thorarchaeota archaeon]|nr:MAG: (Fe-S)-binding protein [Candidatus Thorarchaeota archaeon]
MTDSEKTAQQVRMCAACPKMCRHVCPTFFAWRSDSPTPHGRALLLHHDNLGLRQLDERAVEVIYQCLECSHCLTWCLPEIDIATIVEDARRILVSQDRFPKGLETIRSSVLSNHNPFCEPHEKRVAKIRFKKTKSADVIYFTGCTAAYREHGIANASIEALKEFGFNVSIPDDEWCCGSPLLRTGFTSEALEQARHNVEILNEMSGETILTTCPGCYRVLTQDYPVNDLRIEKPVMHLSQFLAKHIDKVPKGNLAGGVTFHDPCHLGRHCGVYEEPRLVIERITGESVKEMERSRDNAMCCGNGAGFRTLFSSQAKKIGGERVRQAALTGSRYLITACPFCRNLLASEAGETLEVLDLPELVMTVLRKR